MALDKVFDRGRRYNHFPRVSGSETFYLTGEANGVKNWSADGRVRHIRRHNRYDDVFVQCGFLQRKKWFVALFPSVRAMIDRLEVNDNIHFYGTCDVWGVKRVYVIFGILKYPKPTKIEIDEFETEMKLWRLQNKKDMEEDELEPLLRRFHDTEQHNFDGREQLENPDFTIGGDE